MVTPNENISAFVRSGRFPSVISNRSSGARYLESPSLISSPFERFAIRDKPRSEILYFSVFE